MRNGISPAFHAFSIPHNAILQQLGYPVNVIAGIGSAAEGNYEEVAQLLQESARGRQIVRLVRSANALASVKSVAAFGELYNSAYWASRPYRGTEAHLARPCEDLAEFHRGAFAPGPPLVPVEAAPGEQDRHPCRGLAGRLGARGLVPLLDRHERPRLYTDFQDELVGVHRPALDALMPHVHASLLAVARRYLGRERPGHTLQPSALVNEAYLRLVGERSMRWENRAHFIGVAAQLMRFILVDHCRRKQYSKRGGRAVHVTLDESIAVAPARGEELIALDEALRKLAAIDGR